MSKLVTLVAAVETQPTLEQTDSILTELGQMPRNNIVLGLIDALLEYRTLLVSLTT